MLDFIIATHLHTPICCLSLSVAFAVALLRLHSLSAGHYDSLPYLFFGGCADRLLFFSPHAQDSINSHNRNYASDLSAHPYWWPERMLSSVILWIEIAPFMQIKWPCDVDYISLMSSSAREKKCSKWVRFGRSTKKKDSNRKSPKRIDVVTLSFDFISKWKERLFKNDWKLGQNSNQSDFCSSRSSNKRREKKRSKSWYVSQDVGSFNLNRLCPQLLTLASWRCLEFQM